MPLTAYLVMPDLSKVKVRALKAASSILGGPVPIMVSFPVTQWKKSVLPRLRELVEGGWVRAALDSGGYYFRGLTAGELRGRVLEYAAVVAEYSRYLDFFAALDVPGDPAVTTELLNLLIRELERLGAPLEKLVPVVQGTDPGTYRGHATSVLGIIREYSPNPVLGVGGLDGELRRVDRAAAIIRAIPHGRLHLFGGNFRMLRGLRRRGLLSKIWSTDTSTWQHEIRYRRRNHGRTTEEVNKMSIVRTIERFREIVGDT